MSDSSGNDGRRDSRPHGNRAPRSSGRPTGGRPGEGRPSDGGPRRDNAAGGPARGKLASGGPDRPARPPRNDGSGRPERGGRPDRGSGRSDGPPEKRLWTKGGAPARGDRDASAREPEEDRDPYGIRSVRAFHQAPEIPEGITPKMLDRIASNELKTLSKENAEGVALHLVMVSQLIESDPALAHQHAISAARRAGRIGVVRETLAITAYATEDYALALRELRTYRRISGSDDQLPMMVDSERGLERPERALELGRSVRRSTLSTPVQVELAIAMSGARLDLGQAEEALVELQIPQLDPTKAFSYSPALFGAYGTVLEELGREEEAAIWFERADIAAEALDDDGEATVEVFEEEVEFDDASFEDSDGVDGVAEKKGGNEGENGERVN
ncbi:hypothetical protein FB472_0421 [Rhodoglobus vestalii]|uniref:Tetratricopeptide repeat protein n=1 Tax=Rhodoglobus vestalii TaxID=193384 RepID=A0A8H2PXK9_9MICO|nr:hypothetical protein [Rhodoglobus vestalii]TQO18893.1 hypothetical protein FB472_0421 [Rhodoglobus vestalii]